MVAGLGRKHSHFEIEVFARQRDRIVGEHGRWNPVVGWCGYLLAISIISVEAGELRTKIGGGKTVIGDCDLGFTQGSAPSARRIFGGWVKSWI